MKMIFNNEEYYPNPGFNPVGEEDLVWILYEIFHSRAISLRLFLCLVTAEDFIWDGDSGLKKFWRPIQCESWIKSPNQNPLPNGVLVQTRTFLCGHWNYRNRGRPCESVDWDSVFNVEYKIIQAKSKPILRLVK